MQDKELQRFLFSEDELALYILLLADSLFSDLLAEDADLLARKKELLSEELEAEMPLEESIVSIRKKLPVNRLATLRAVIPFIEDEGILEDLLIRLPESTVTRLAGYAQSATGSTPTKATERFKTHFGAKDSFGEKSSDGILLNDSSMDLATELLEDLSIQKTTEKFLKPPSKSNRPYSPVFGERDIESRHLPYDGTTPSLERSLDRVQKAIEVASEISSSDKLNFKTFKSLADSKIEIADLASETPHDNGKGATSQPKNNSKTLTNLEVSKPLGGRGRIILYN